MRKTIFTLLMLAVAIGMSAHELLSNAEVDAQWRTKTISVKNGGQSPNVVMLLKAFNKALPTWVVGEVLYLAAHQRSPHLRHQPLRAARDAAEPALLVRLRPTDADDDARTQSSRRLQEAIPTDGDWLDTTTEGHRIRGFFHAKPEEDAPWTGKEIVAYTSDFMHINYPHHPRQCGGSCPGGSAVGTF